MTRFAILLLLTLTPVLSGAAEPQTDVPTASASKETASASKETASAGEETASAGQENDPAAEGDTTHTSFWMEKKLEHSQAILRALAMGDFEDVRYNASRLKLLNRVEGFVRRKNPEYRVHLNTFSRVSAEIERQAEKKNIEGATLAFNQLTVSCVDCHKSMRVEAETSAEE